jgi:hypothetical protein
MVVPIRKPPAKERNLAVIAAIQNIEGMSLTIYRKAPLKPRRKHRQAWN